MNCWPKGAAHAGRTRLLKGYLSNYRARDVNLRVRNDLWPGSRDACQHLKLFLNSERPKGLIDLERQILTSFSPAETVGPQM